LLSISTTILLSSSTGIAAYFFLRTSEAHSFFAFALDFERPLVERKFGEGSLRGIIFSSALSQRNGLFLSG
jgi:hypothetical protein